MCLSNGARPESFENIACFFLVFLFYFFETGSYYVALASLELTIQTRMALNEQRSTCLCLPNADVTGMYYHLATPPPRVFSFETL